MCFVCGGGGGALIEANVCFVWVAGGEGGGRRTTLRQVPQVNSYDLGPKVTSTVTRPRVTLCVLVGR